MNKIKIQEVLLRKNLCCYPPENEAAKYYHKFLLEHPEYDNNEIQCKIDSIEREEDHYGNGGGYDNTLIIFRYREETDEEYNNRILELERNLVNKYSDKFENIFKELYYDLTLIKSNNIDFYKRIISIINKKIDFYIKNSF